MTTATQNEITVGTIFVSSWGYDQTNVCFYRVVKRTAATVTLQRVRNHVVTAGDMTGRVVPHECDHQDVPIRRKLSTSYGDAIVRIDSCEFAREWNGKPQSFSSYA
jgi:hypothetical protein